MVVAFQVRNFVSQARHPQMIPSSRLAADLQWLLESGAHSDVELSAGGRVLKAHRAILSARYV